MSSSIRINPAEISSAIQAQLETFSLQPIPKNQGKILSIKDGIVEIYGLNEVQSGEMIQFHDNLFGIALNLEENMVGAVVLGSTSQLQEGQTVYGTGKIIEVPVGEKLLGRVVNALGQPIDGQGPINTGHTEPVEKIAPGVIWRKSVDQSLHTGITSIDTTTPIGKGQRELIIGDRQTGKTTIAIDTILNQKNTGVICVYVAIGQKAATVADIVNVLRKNDALSYTIVVTANASDTAALQYIAPYSGCSMAEFFRDQGQDALIIYDDLSKHATAYRQISLLLRRPPGREAYPGDIFYLHSRLLERAARVNESYIEKKTNGKVRNKTGSLTALPIVETQAGDVSAFIPTNVISITDGQIFLETDLFNAGVRPAINAGLSVSRVGGAAQTPIVKKLGGGLRIALAQYRELESFSQFASDLDAQTQKQLQTGKRITELLKQPPYSPFSLAEVVVILLLSADPFLQKIPSDEIQKTCSSILDYFNTQHQNFMNNIDKNPKLTTEIKENFSTILETYQSVHA